MADWTALYFTRQGLRERESAPAREAAECLKVLYPRNVELVIGATDTAYPEAISSLWHRPGKLIIIEQDIEVYPKHVQSFLDCGALACAWQYYIFPASSGGLKVYPTVTAQWAHYAPSGFCCLSEQIRLSAGWPGASEWGRVEHALQRVAQSNRGQWHIHKPAVNHHHGMIQANRETVLVPDGLGMKSRYAR